MKTDLFQSCATAEFSKFAGILSAPLSQHPFRIWNSSAGIPSPPLALFIVMLPKAHLTLHSRMSGSKWVITPSWLSGSWISFLYSFSVYSCHLFLISSASVRSIPKFLSFMCAHLCMKCSLGISNFLEEISKSCPFYCFPLFLFIDHWGRLCYLSFLFFGTLHSNGNIFPFLLCFSLLFFSQLFVRPTQTAILFFFIFFSWGWSWSLPLVQYHEPPSIVLQALYQI